MRITSKKLAGPGFIILNVIRALNITSLVAVMAASVVMVVKTFTMSKVRHRMANGSPVNAKCASVLLF